jgi:hypothetical protein
MKRGAGLKNRFLRLEKYTDRMEFEQMKKKIERKKLFITKSER